MKKRYEDGGKVESGGSMGIKDVLGSLSPLYGMASGKGAFGNDVGLLPMAARGMRNRMSREEESPTIISIGIEKGEEPEEMRSGGMVRSNIDGCAIRGKTKGKNK